MKILFVAQRSWYGIGPSGGAETMAHDLMAYLARQGWDAQAMFLSKENRTTTVVDGVPVHTRRTLRDFDDLTARADVIVTHLGATPMAKKSAAKFNKPVVQLVHNTNKFTVGFLGNGCDFAIYNSQWVSDFHKQAIERKLIYVWESKYLANIQTRKDDAWPSVVVHPPALGEIKPPSEGEHITLVNLTPNKGPEIMYKLAELNPDLKFMGVLGGYDDELQDVRQRHNVVIHPHVSRQEEFYRKTRVILMPSNYESYGRIAVEGMQYGIPTIAHPTPGLEEALGASGMLADREDISAWNTALHATLAEYGDLRQKAFSRYNDLRQQSEKELQKFAEVMEEVGRGYNHPG